MSTAANQVSLTRRFELLSISRGARRFIWHFVQMVVAMLVGMSVYHLLTGKALVAYPVVNFALMELSMVLPMVALMRYHRHSWQRTWEMAAVMLAGPALAALCVQFGLHTYIAGLSYKTFFTLGDIAMYLGMLGIMLYRRAEYIAGHTDHHHASSPQNEMSKDTVMSNHIEIE